MEDTKIQWCDHTFNHMRGCTKVSPGCAHCYAETLSKRNPKVLGEWGPGKPRVRASAKAWLEPERWNRTELCGACGRAQQIEKRRPCCGGIGVGGPNQIWRRPRVFCASMADWLDDADVRMPDGRIDRGGVETLARLLDLIRRTPNLDWLLLTKRPENWESRLVQAEAYLNRGSLSDAGTWAWIADWISGRKIPPNVWFMWSAEDQERYDQRTPIGLSVPAVVHGVSIEPMLGEINLTRAPFKKLDGSYGYENPLIHPISEATARRYPDVFGEDRGARIDWCIFGGESGSKARPCNVEWIRGGVQQCREAGVKAFVKQLGQRVVWHDDPTEIIGGRLDGLRVPNYELRRLRDRKGGDPAEWPEDLRVREWPTANSAPSSSTLVEGGGR